MYVLYIWFTLHGITYDVDMYNMKDEAACYAAIDKIHKYAPDPTADYQWGCKLKEDING